MLKKLHGLYVITNEQLMPPGIFSQMAEAALIGGASILQYRDKSHDADKRLRQAKDLKKLCLKYNAIFIINDDLSLAKQLDADGIHIGKNDLAYAQAREELGAEKIIGVSCYNQLSLARNSINQGADYIAFGSFFGSSIKPNAAPASPQLITEFKKTSAAPVCCIGGINAKNCGPLLKSGADMLAVISDVFSCPDSKQISIRCQQFAKKF